MTCYGWFARNSSSSPKTLVWGLWPIVGAHHQQNTPHFAFASPTISSHCALLPKKVCLALSKNLLFIYVSNYYITMHECIRFNIPSPPRPKCVMWMWCPWCARRSAELGKCMHHPIIQCVCVCRRRRLQHHDGTFLIFTFQWKWSNHATANVCVRAYVNHTNTFHVESTGQSVCIVLAIVSFHPWPADRSDWCCCCCDGIACDVHRCTLHTCFVVAVLYGGNGGDDDYDDDDKRMEIGWHNYWYISALCFVWRTAEFCGRSSSMTISPSSFICARPHNARSKPNDNRR